MKVSHLTHPRHINVPHIFNINNRHFTLLSFVTGNEKKVKPNSKLVNQYMKHKLTSPPHQNVRGNPPPHTAKCVYIEICKSSPPQM